MDPSHRVVIVGGGFGGLHTAHSLRDAPVQVTLIDRRNFHLFQPLLYQVATGSLSPANIASPLRAVLARHRNAEVLLAEVVDVDVAGRRSTPPEARILLLEPSDRTLPPYPPPLSARAAAALARLGVTVWTGALVTDIRPGVVTVRRGGGSEQLPTFTVLWAAGVEASP